MKTGIELIADERARQISVEGWTPEHDDGHKDGSLAAAGACYALKAQDIVMMERVGASGDWHPDETWPWEFDWWKPSDDPVRNLVKAGALIAAEIDRLQRRKQKAE